jgi:hypothetical protein
MPMAQSCGITASNAKKKETKARKANDKALAAFPIRY